MKRQPRYSKGQRIGGRFLVHQALMGGMGEVYLCLDEKEMSPYALKTFQDNSPGLRDIFKQEVASWIALEKHPNIVRCFWMQIFDNIPFMALEWVAGDEGRGTDLRSWLRHGPLLLPLALRFTVDIVRGLLHANSKVPGIVHRDLKPDNVLVNQSKQAKITDFGLATIVQQSGIATPSSDAEGAALGESMRVGNVVGTPYYMPPEQWRDEDDLDFRTDLYAVGCILYEMLTGRSLYNGRTLNELRAQHLSASIPQLNGDFPAEVKQILEKCLAKQREARFERLDLLLAVLTQLYEAHTGDSLPEVAVSEFSAVDYSNRGTTYDNLGQHQLAIADHDRSIELDPNLAPAYSNRGNSYAVLGQHEGAIADSDRALQLDPNFAAAYIIRGNSYAALGQRERAIADFDRAIKIDPNLAVSYYNRGNSYAALGQHEGAIADYDRAIRLDPTFVHAYYNRGHRYGDLAQYEQAIADFDRAIKLDPNLAQAYYNRGNSYLALGQRELAMADYDRAIKLDPDLAQAYYNRGHSYGALGQHEQAIADFGRAIQLDPDDATAYYNRGHSYAALGQHEGAIADFGRAIQLDPDKAKAYYNRGNSYAALGQHEGAIADYDRAIRLDPNFVQAWLNKGAVLANTGNLEESLPCFEKAAALGHPQAAEVIQQVRQALGMAPAQPAANDPQAAFEAFFGATTPDAMRQAVQQHPTLKQMIPAIEQVITEQVPPELKPEFEQRLAWLKQIAAERK